MSYPETPALGSIYFSKVRGDYMIFTEGGWVTVRSGQTNENELLLEKHPGLAELKKELDEAKERYEAYYALCKEETDANSNSSR